MLPSKLVAWALRFRHVEIYLAIGVAPIWEVWLMHHGKKRLRLLSCEDKQTLIDIVRQAKRDATWGAQYVAA
ncbi:hypothetical protein [Blastopirellula retiformator]|uniref:Uncharacterized protein n=1 Tax=Blastopirellula retiformator TaxID=2527970 RepID=A0A5C5VL94_9BACT|nr:hypothetical protein [Blastopirellula retiformator]TWT38690.1 hypothetical protein Enr8_03840 [Blastopirellula retiformator]